MIVLTDINNFIEITKIQDTILVIDKEIKSTETYSNVIHIMNELMANNDAYVSNIKIEDLPAKYSHFIEKLPMVVGFARRDFNNPDFLLEGK